MPSINCEITLDLNWSENCVIVATNIADQDTAFSAFTYGACGPFTKNKEKGDSRYIYQNKLDKACF